MVDICGIDINHETTRNLHNTNEFLIMIEHQSCYMDKLLAENAKIQHILNTFSPLQNPNRWYIRNVKSTEKKRNQLQDDEKRRMDAKLNKSSNYKFTYA